MATHDSSPPSASGSPVPPEEKDALWQLLGASPPPLAPSRFSADVLRRIRQESPTARFPHLSSRLAWLLGAPAFAAALALAFVTFHQLGAPAPEGEVADLLPQEHVEILAEELHLMTYVDELLAVSDPSLLDDDGLAELLF